MRWNIMEPAYEVKNSFFEYINPTLKHYISIYFDIVSDIQAGSKYGILILACYLAVFLPCILAFYLALDILFGIYSDMLSSKYSDIWSGILSGI